ncbi:zinc-binding alcohol dehydrogenase [Candidatus Bathyarchaeota archaeon]|nr:zinc-binding alcohol dehydrogenase [Candidatus Bathyarchaeota archaeon]MBS7613298.1 zinc-binding alcohol dehydrogenase [Candidatus Bathyarchaeota archaeon]MBS7617947.1 zinc-binding alcohol dehydrogenase [Candidatus Bathyarchaeota archaeon]
MKAKCVVFKSRGVVDVEELKIGKPQSGYLLVKTICSLISPGTETAFLMALPNTTGIFPQYPGYSNIGIVEEVGENVKDFKPGDVVASPSRHSSHVLVHESEALKTPEGLSAEEASFFNIAAIALQGVRKGFIELGSSVVVVGQGLIGLLATQFAALSGAFPLIAVDVIDSRLKLSTRLGADYALNPTEADAVEEIMRLTDGRGADVVIEATGNPNAIPTALNMAGKLGRVVILGSPRGLSTVNFYMPVHRKGLVIIGAHNSVRPKYESLPHFWTDKDDMKLTLKLITKGRLKVKELISLKLPVEKAPEAYRLIMERKEEILGVLLCY